MLNEALVFGECNVKPYFNVNTECLSGKYGVSLNQT